jgi:NADH dehydrogenase [ubiquinone] 1 alpha subcomplex assembly factor 6
LKINRKYDFENYLSTLLIKSSSLRRSAFAIRAFNAELSQIRDLTSTQLMAQLRLQFWSDLIDQIYSNEHIISSANQPIAYEIQTVFHFNYYINSFIINYLIF